MDIDGHDRDVLVNNYKELKALILNSELTTLQILRTIEPRLEYLDSLVFE